MKFGQLVAVTRLRKNMSVDKLAWLADTQCKTIRAIEKGISPDLYTADKICKVLGITWVLGGDKCE